ncbi:NifU family protein [Actimicrobium antarcticum]|uniref:Fe-S biogenesis protein NfuA n=1 Tax=Actimicrobium antarcticum TaxID=1051899 RepID=A0ABP7SXS0_9BURK
MTPHITFSNTALTHFRELLDRQDDTGTQLRIYVLHPGTSLGHCGIAYWHPAAGTPEDASIDAGTFRLYYVRQEAAFLDGVSVDFRKTFSGHTLALQAPNAKSVVVIDENSPLAHRITRVLETEINTHLSEHGGTVMLDEIREGGVVALKFGGGCHGCGNAEQTLKETVEATLLKWFPDITRVVDGTNHSDGVAPYLPRKTPVAA